MRGNRARKRTILINGRGSGNALEDEGKIGLESALFKLMVDGWKMHSKVRENRVGKRTILIDGRGSENALEDEEK